LEVYDYAHRYLGVRRLPNGVPAMLDEIVRDAEGRVHPQSVAAVLRSFRRPPWVL
jgi:hypothetical protein